MATRKGNNPLAALGQINLATAIAMMVFSVMGLIMTGLAGEAISLMEQHQYLPLTASFGALAFIFASSNTRDFRFYETWEVVLTVFCVLVMVAHAFVVQFQDIIAAHSPYGAVAVLVLMTVTSAVLAK